MMFIADWKKGLAGVLLIAFSLFPSGCEIKFPPPGTSSTSNTVDPTKFPSSGTDSKSNTPSNSAVPTAAPMTPAAAQRIADAFGCILPTTQMVDDIYQNAQTRLPPRPMPAGSQMTTNAYFADHNRLVEGQRQSAGHQSGNLLAGHKKDIVITNSLDRNPSKVAIYGWHQTNGRPIQNLTTVHGRDYVDYSHGVRLIRKTVRVDGREMNIDDVLRDPVLSALVSKEGPIQNTRAIR
jgi:hypothetical protein